MGTQKNHLIFLSKPVNITNISFTTDCTTWWCLTSQSTIFCHVGRIFRVEPVHTVLQSNSGTCINITLAAIKNCNTIDKRRSKITRNSVFNCHLKRIVIHFGEKWKKIDPRPQIPYNIAWDWSCDGTGPGWMKWIRHTHVPCTILEALAKGSWLGWPEPAQLVFLISCFHLAEVRCEVPPLYYTAWS